MRTTFRKLTAAWPLVIFLLLPLIMRAETAVQTWVQRYNGPGNGEDRACAVAVDGSNNVIVTGYSYDSGSYFDYATIKYSNAGVPLWTTRYNGPGNRTDQPCAVAVDGSNNVIVTGASTGGGNNGSRLCDDQIFERGSAALDQSLQRAGSNWDTATALAVDHDDNVIVTGEVDGSVSPSDGDYATIKYSSLGEVLWINSYNGPGNARDRAYAVAVDGSNNVIVTGHSLVVAAMRIITITGLSSIPAQASCSGLTSTTGRETAMTTPGPGGGRQQQRDRDGEFAWQRRRSRIRDDQVFERGRAALDQPLHRPGEPAVGKPWPWWWTAATT